MNEPRSARSARALYLDLMKRCLTDSLYIDDPLANSVPYREKSSTPQWRRRLLRQIGKFLGRHGIRMVERNSLPWMPEYAGMGPHEIAALRAGGKDWPARAHTMIGLRRLDNLQYCVETAIEEGVPGDLIETGVWRGGACIFMRAILAAFGDTGRKVWVADSFAGLPKPDAATYAADAGDIHHSFSEVLAVPRQQVAANFARYGLLDDRVRFLEGWFKDTLPTAPIQSLAVMRLDGDMYQSTIEALDALYPKLSPGGFVIIDDFFLQPCAQAVTDFRARHAITEPIQDIDGMGAFWRRPKDK